MTNEVIRMTPVGKSKFVYISEKDTQFDSNGIYHCSVEFSKEEAKPEIKAIHEEIAKDKLNGYDQTIGVGCSLYLLSVQVVDLVKGSSQNETCPFPKVESALPAPEAKAVY